MSKQYPAVIGETGCNLLNLIKEEFGLKNSTEAFTVLSETATNNRFTTRPVLDDKGEAVLNDDGSNVMETVDRFQLATDKIESSRTQVKLEKTKERLVRQMFEIDPEAARSIDSELVAKWEAEAEAAKAKAEEKAAEEATEA